MSARAPFRPRGLPTAIGSLPHRDPQEACALIWRYLPDIPVWPQLPHRSPLENMYAQYSRGFPGVHAGTDRVWVDRSQDLIEGLAQLFADAEAGATEPYALTADYAAGLASFLETARRQGTPVAVKGQLIGPVSWGLTVTDQDRRSLLYDDTLAEAIAQMLRLQAAWQERALRAVSPRTILFLDEPYLSAFGSAVVPLSREQAVSLITTVLEGISGLRGTHCCGNTDWPLLLETPLDILSFDAFSYAPSLSLYPREVTAFLERGGTLAWGIVPSDGATLAVEGVDSLLRRLDEAMALLSAKGLNPELLREQCLITPSCGLASLTPEAAERALALTAGVSRAFRER
ncbi:MAG: Methionine synthase [Dehalococcoidia bacterium]|nr:Methionine synthase [Dehalococcoidia bacterium]